MVFVLSVIQTHIIHFCNYLVVMIDMVVLERDNSSCKSGRITNVHSHMHTTIKESIFDAPVRRVERIKLEQVKRAQGRPEKTWMEVIRQDIEAKVLNEGILLDRNERRKLMHVPDPA